MRTASTLLVVVIALVVVIGCNTVDTVDKDETQNRFMSLENDMDEVVVKLDELAQRDRELRARIVALENDIDALVVTSLENDVDEEGQ